MLAGELIHMTYTMILLTLGAGLPVALGCNGTVSSAAGDAGARPDRAAPGDAAADAAAPDASARRDAGADASGSRDAAPPDAPAAPYLEPPVDAAVFDACAGHVCEGGLCVQTIIQTDIRSYGVCYHPPAQCGSDPSCSCVVESATWCLGATCSPDGGLILACAPPPHGHP